MTCDALDPLIEAIADGSQPIDRDMADHLASCARCTARLGQARAIEDLLALREVAAPSSSFTAGVMQRVGRDRWRTERAIDLGFNLAVAAGLLVIAAGGAGLAWSLGLLHISIDFETLWDLATAPIADRVVSQVQTILMSAALLTTALVLWWWVESTSD